MRCHKCGTEVPDNSRFCNMCGADLSENGNSNTQRPYGFFVYPNASDLPMNWYRFLVMMSLPIGAFNAIFNGFSMVTGVLNSEIYSNYPSMRWVDIVFGIMFFAQAIYMMLTRKRLVGFFKNGPKMLYSVYLVTSTLGIIYEVISYYMIVQTASDPSMISSVSASLMVYCIAQAFAAVFMYAVNTKYFKKREHLFVN